MSYIYYYTNFLNMGKYKIIKFGKKGCAPCEQVESYLSNSGVEFESVDVTKEDDETLELCSQYGIGMSIPKTLLVDNENGEVIEMKNGFNPVTLNVVINKYKENL